MSADTQDGLTIIKWVFLIVVGGAVAYGLIYALIFILLFVAPYFLFCGIPFVCLSVLIGASVFYFCRVEVQEQKLSDLHAKGRYEKPVDERAWEVWKNRVVHDAITPLRYDYRRLLYFFPALVLVVFVAVGVPENHSWVERLIAQGWADGSGESGQSRIKHVHIGKKKVDPPQAQKVWEPVIEWPRVYETFNWANGAWWGYFSILNRGKPYEAVLFDRNWVSAIVWLSLLLGMPLVFFYFSASAFEAEEWRRRGEVIQLLGLEREAWQEEQARWTHENLGKQAMIDRLSEKYQQVSQELERFRTQEQLATGLKVEVKKAREKKGVLDSDLL